MGHRGNARLIMHLDLPHRAGLDLGDLGRSTSYPCFELYTGIAPIEGPY
jgi:hypothetical protein